VVEADGSTRHRLGYALEQYVNAGNTPAGLRALMYAGVVTALFMRGTRRPAAVSLLLGALFVVLAVRHDPLSRRGAFLFYGQPARVLYLQYFFLPVLGALPLLWLWRRIAERQPVRVRTVLLLGAAAACIAAILVPGYPHVVRNMRSQAGAVPFTEAEYRLARRIPDVVRPGGLIANYWDDGSTWAMHVSGRRFLQPLSWRLRDPQGRLLRDAALALADRPWPDGAAALRALGVTHLYVSDLRWSGGDPLPVSRALFDADPRFEPVLRGGRAALYRILWNEGNDLRSERSDS
jgi:hypothetical protein